MKLLTGSEGFIASNLEADLKLTRNDCDLTNYESVLNILNDYLPDTVIHCAAKHGSALEMMNNHSEYINNNILSDLNIIKACKETGVRNLLMLSTITSFDPSTPSPFTEQSINGNINEKIFGYAFSKKICVGLCKAYQMDYGLNYKSTFLGNTYGPFGLFNDNATVIHNLIYKFVKAKKEGKDVNLYGDGKAIRNYIYVKDLNPIFNKIINDESIKEPLIVSSEFSCSILELVEIIKQNLSFQGKVFFDSNVSHGEQIKIVDIKKLKDFLGDFNFTTIETGIRETIKWYLKKYNL